MRSRLIFAFALVAIISIVIVVLVFRGETTNEVRGFVRRGGGFGLTNVVSFLEDYYRLNGSWDGVDRLMDSLMHPRQTGMMPPQQGFAVIRSLRWRLAGETGQVLYDSENQGTGRMLSPAEIESASAIVVDEKKVGWLVVDISSEYENRSINPLLQRINRAAYLAALFACGVALLAGLGLSYGLVRPIRSLIQAAGRLGQGDLSQRVEVSGNDEMAALGQAFNRMAESLQRAEESRRAMTADIAHELRTPLAVQRAQLEALRDGIYEISPQTLETALDQNALLTRLVDDLRTLTQADTGKLLLNCMPVDLMELAEKVAEKFTAEAQTRDIQIERHFDPGCPQVNLDTDRVEQILGNLFSNALRFTQTGGKITMDASCSEGRVELNIHDSGPGIPPGALPYVFDRFYRADKSRSRQGGGSGLGLAIARQLARAHGGEINAANHPEGGAMFTVTFPIQRKI